MRALRLGGLQAAGDEGTGRPSSKGPAAGGAPGREQGRGGGPRRKKNRKSTSFLPPPQTSAEVGFEDVGEGRLGRGMQEVLHFVSFLSCPHPLPNILFRHRIVQPRVSNPRLHSWVPGLWFLSQAGSLTLASTRRPSLAPAFLNADYPLPHLKPPTSGCRAPGEAPLARYSGMLFSSLGSFFSQREHHHTPSVQHQGRTAEISRSP